MRRHGAPVLVLAPQGDDGLRRPGWFPFAYVTVRRSPDGYAMPPIACAALRRCAHDPLVFSARTTDHHDWDTGHCSNPCANMARQFSSWRRRGMMACVSLQWQAGSYCALPPPNVLKPVSPHDAPARAMGAHHIIGVFGQPRSRLGVAHELNTGLMQRLSDASASMRLALGGDDAHSLPIGDGVDIETGRYGQIGHATNRAGRAPR